VSQAHVSVRNPARARAPGECAREAELRSAALRRHDLHLVERALEDAGTQGLEAGFFGSESRRERLRPVHAARARGQLCRREHALLKSFEGACQTLRRDDVEPDPDDHARSSTLATAVSYEGSGASAPPPSHMLVRVVATARATTAAPSGVKWSWSK